VEVLALVQGLNTSARRRHPRYTRDAAVGALAHPEISACASRSSRMEITLKDGVLRQNGYNRDVAVAGAAEAALAVASLTTVVPVDLVRPVLCFVRDAPVSGWARDVMVCSTGNLLGLLASRPAVLTATQVRDASLQLDAALHAAVSESLAPVAPRRPARAARASLPRPRPRPRTVSARRKRKTGPSVARLLIAVMLLGVLLTQPQVVTGLGQLVASILMGQSR